MPPAVHPGGTYRCIGRQASSEPAGQEGTVNLPEPTRAGTRRQLSCRLTRSYWQPWGLTPKRTGMSAYWRRTGRSEQMGGVVIKMSSQFVAIRWRRRATLVKLTPVTAWEQFLISPVWLIWMKEQRIAIIRDVSLDHTHKLFWVFWFWEYDLILR